MPLRTLPFIPSMASQSISKTPLSGRLLGSVSVGVGSVGEVVASGCEVEERWDSKKVLNQTWATDVTIVKPYVALLRRSKSMLMSDVGSMMGSDGRKITALAPGPDEVLVVVDGTD